VGADAVIELADRAGERLRRGKERALVAELRIGKRRLAVAIPQTYMNDSGQAAAPLVRRFAVELDRVVALHDELDLPVGTVRVKVGGGLAGHNGLKSLKSHLHSDAFVRVRIGVGRPPGRMAGADYVLRRPGKAEREELDVAVAKAADIVTCILAEGAEVAMNRYNGG
jgi:PTH1 family peptidyl-tRNA hydrolase